MEVSGELYVPAAVPLGRNPGTYPTVGRVGPKVGLDILEKRKICCLSGKSNRNPPTSIPEIKLT